MWGEDAGFHDFQFVLIVMKDCSTVKALGWEEDGPELPQRGKAVALRKSLSNGGLVCDATPTNQNVNWETKMCKKRPARG